MDLSYDFPNNKVHDAQAIIQRLDDIIKDIEKKKSQINKIHYDIDSESTKLDFIIKSIHEIKQSMVEDYHLKSFAAELEQKMDIKLYNLKENIKTYVNNTQCTNFKDDDDLHITPIAISAILGFSFGILLCLFTKK